MTTYEFPYFVQEEQILVPHIFDAGAQEEIPIQGFNAVRIPLDGSLRSDLNWSTAMDQAQRVKQRGLRILWDLDLGLFNRLLLPLSDQTQWHSLQLAAHHLVDLINHSYLSDTLGVIVYRGALGLGGEGAFADSVEYLRQLVFGWPDAVTPVVLLDASRVTSPSQVVQMTHREWWGPVALAVRGTPLPLSALGWDRSSAYGVIGRHPFLPVEDPRARLGLCLPREGGDWDEVFRSLSRKGEPYRIVSANHLTAEWDGLDHLYLGYKNVDQSLQRKIQGFQAAGGTVSFLC